MFSVYQGADLEALKAQDAQQRAALAALEAKLAARDAAKSSPDWQAQEQPAVASHDVSSGSGIKQLSWGLPSRPASATATTPSRQQQQQDSSHAGAFAVPEDHERKQLSWGLPSRPVSATATTPSRQQQDSSHAGAPAVPEEHERHGTWRAPGPSPLGRSFSAGARAVADGDGGRATLRALLEALELGVELQHTPLTIPSVAALVRQQFALRHAADVKAAREVVARQAKEEQALAVAEALQKGAAQLGEERRGAEEDRRRARAEMERLGREVDELQREKRGLSGKAAQQARDARAAAAEVEKLRALLEAESAKAAAAERAAERSKAAAARAASEAHKGSKALQEAEEARAAAGQARAQLEQQAARHKAEREAAASQAAARDAELQAANQALQGAAMQVEAKKQALADARQELEAARQAFAAQQEQQLAELAATKAALVTVQKALQQAQEALLQEKAALQLEVTQLQAQLQAILQQLAPLAELDSEALAPAAGDAVKMATAVCKLLAHMQEQRAEQACQMAGASVEIESQQRAAAAEAAQQALGARLQQEQERVRSLEASLAAERSHSHNLAREVSARSAALASQGQKLEQALAELARKSQEAEVGKVQQGELQGAVKKLERQLEEARLEEDAKLSSAAAAAAAAVRLEVSQSVAALVERYQFAAPVWSGQLSGNDGTQQSGSAANNGGGGEPAVAATQQPVPLQKALQLLQAPLAGPAGGELPQLSHEQLLSAYDAFKQKKEEVLQKGLALKSGAPANQHVSSAWAQVKAAVAATPAKAAAAHQELAERMVQLEGGVLRALLQLRERDRQVAEAARLLSTATMAATSSHPVAPCRPFSCLSSRKADATSSSAAARDASPKPAVESPSQQHGAALAAAAVKPLILTGSCGRADSHRTRPLPRPPSAPEATRALVPSSPRLQRVRSMLADQSPSSRAAAQAAPSSADAFRAAAAAWRGEEDVADKAGVADANSGQMANYEDRDIRACGDQAASRGARVMGVASAVDVSAPSDDIQDVLDLLGGCDLRSSRGLSGIRSQRARSLAEYLSADRMQPQPPQDGPAAKQPASSYASKLLAAAAPFSAPSTPRKGGSLTAAAAVYIQPPHQHPHAPLMRSSSMAAGRSRTMPIVAAAGPAARRS